MKNLNQEKTKSQTLETKTTKKVIFIILSIILAVVLFFGGFFVCKLTLKSQTKKADNIISTILNEGYIIDPETGELKELSDDDVANYIAQGFLDQYSKYYTEEEYENAKKKSAGSYSGIGISFYDSSSCVVEMVNGNSPAFYCGIKKDDVIVYGKLGLERVDFSNLSDFSTFINNIDDNVDFTLGITREESFTEKEVTLQKQNYRATYVFYQDSDCDYSFTYENSTLKGIESAGGNTNIPLDTFYIKINKFEGECASQLKWALDFAKQKGKSKLILDLCNNPGGDMKVLLDVCALLVYNNGKSGTMVYTISKKGENSYSTTTNSFYYNITHISVLANEGSASASECLIGALAVLGGDTFNLDSLVLEKNKDGIAKTYGKGIMQTTFIFFDGSALKLTTAKVCWPNEERTCIHGKGVTVKDENCVEKGSALNKAIEILNAKN